MKKIKIIYNSKYNKNIKYILNMVFFLRHLKMKFHTFDNASEDFSIRCIENKTFKFKVKYV